MKALYENGINKGRVSKLCIYKTGMRDRSKPWHEQLDYNYVRGDSDGIPCNLSEKDIDVVVTALEKLPPSNVKVDFT